MSQALRTGITGLEITTRATLAILALASGVYTYIGVRGLLNGDAAVTFLGAVIYSTAVSVAIYTFWSYLMRFLPKVRTARMRRLLYGSMVLGSLMIVAMSSWLNAAALAGSAALEQHLANALEDYQQRLDKAHNNALAAQSLLPDIQMASERFARLAEQENATGALTGTSGSGTVVALLTQMSTQLNGLAAEVTNSREQVKSLFDQGGKHLARMRELVSSSAPIEPRSNEFAEQAVELNGVIAALQQTSVAPAVKRAAQDLSQGFIAPAADGSTASLVERQSEVVGRVEKSVAAQSTALAAAADEILAQDFVEPVRFNPLSSPEAVLRYASDFVPSWAGAISIDLMPAVLILILCIVEAAIRESEDPDIDANAMTAADVMRAVRLYSHMQEQANVRQAEAAEPEPFRKPEIPPNVATLPAKLDRV